MRLLNFLKRVALFLVIAGAGFAILILGADHMGPKPFAPAIILGIVLVFLGIAVLWRGDGS